MDVQSTKIGQYRITSLDGLTTLDGGYFVQRPGQNLVEEAKLFPNARMLIAELKECRAVELYTSETRKFLLRPRKQILEYGPMKDSLEQFCELDIEHGNVCGLV